MLRYEPAGPIGTFLASGRMSVDGVSRNRGGDTTVAVGLPTPQNVAVAPGNRALYVSWEGTGQEAGFRLYYWTAPDRADERPLVLAGGEGFHALGDLENGMNYFAALAALDVKGRESARSAPVSAQPNPAAGAWGEVVVNTNYLGAVTSSLMVTVSDPDLNIDPATPETVLVRVLSDSETNGFWLPLRESGRDTGLFTSEAAGTNLSFTFGPSDPLSKVLQVKEGDAVAALYADTLPSGERVAVAQFMQTDSNGNGVPDWWERVYFGGLGQVTATSDADHDGLCDVDEYQAGTNPTNAASVLQVIISPMKHGEILLQWPSVAGKIYTIEVANDLGTGFYEFQSEIPATPPSNTLPVLGAPSPGHIFYRVKCE